MRVCPLPSAFITYISLFPSRSEVKAILVFNLGHGIWDGTLGRSTPTGPLGLKVSMERDGFKGLSSGAGAGAGIGTGSCLGCTKASFSGSLPLNNPSIFS